MMLDYEKAKRKDNLFVHGRHVSAVENDRHFENHLKNLNNTRTFSKEKFNLGVDFYNSGESLDNIDPAFLKDVGFMSGFNHAKRLAMIQENETTKKGR